MSGTDIVFDGPPDHEAGRFVEAERDGKSVSLEWTKRRDGLWSLRVPDTDASRVHAEGVPEFEVLCCVFRPRCKSRRFAVAAIVDERGRFAAFDPGADHGEPKFYCVECGSPAIAWIPGAKRTVGNQVTLPVKS